MCESSDFTPCKTCGADIEDGVCSGCWEPAEECVCDPEDHLEDDEEEVEEEEEEYEDEDEEDYS